MRVVQCVGVCVVQCVGVCVVQCVDAADRRVSVGLVSYAYF